ncbi:MAG: hypothetical protein R2852_07570 [Bacteroidia bacterium]
MQINSLIKHGLKDIESIIQTIDNDIYSKPSKALNFVSIGEHVRHIIEFFMVLQNQYTLNYVNYDERKRNLRMEKDKVFALEMLNECLSKIETSDKTLSFKMTIKDTTIEIKSTYYRELIYAHEHNIHHQALIKIALNEFEIQNIPLGFGIAESTQRHQQTQKQISSL